jgi:hypothetical protein
MIYLHIFAWTVLQRDPPNDKTFLQCHTVNDNCLWRGSGQSITCTQAIWAQIEEQKLGLNIPGFKELV